MVKVERNSLQSIKDVLAEKGVRAPIRVELCFTGCCTPSLGLFIDAATESDLVYEEGGVTFIIRKETHALTGDITISPGDDPGKKSFTVTSRKPVSEWAGFTACEIRA